jgi:hypothetical protein
VVALDHAGRLLGTRTIPTTPAGYAALLAWAGTLGTVEHVKTGCERGHWFTPTVASLDRRPVPTAADPSPTDRGAACVDSRS